MKKTIKNYLTQLKENDKKGFSLVELIIVMAIMAILVGIVASQVLPYMEKSRQSKDQQVLSAVCTDVVSAIAQSGESCVGGADTLGNLASVANAQTVSEFEGLRSDTPIATIESSCKAQLKSKEMSGKNIYVSINNTTGRIMVYASSAAGTIPTNSKCVVESE